MLKEFLEPMIAGRNLSEKEAREAMQVIMSGQASEAQIGAFLTALRMKGEVSAEVTGFAQTMRAHATQFSCQSNQLIDTCGTGGDSKGTFNVSTTVAFVLAGAGLAVAKHGNRGATSSCGSADLLTALGVNINLSPAAVARSIDQVGIGFLYAPLYHGAMQYVAKSRRELGFRTVFNLLGPLTNPAGAECQLLGVYDASLTNKVAEAMVALGVKRAMVVHSLDGMDEISTAAPTLVSEVQEGVIKNYQIEPSDFGFARAKPEDYLGGMPADNAAITLEILRGALGPKRDIVLINAAAALVVGSMASDLTAGLQLAAKSIDSGAALDKLEALKLFSQSCEGELVLS